MPYYEKTATGTRAHVDKLGVRRSKQFSTLKEARAWAVAAEAELQARSDGVFPEKTLADAFEKYLAEVSIHKPGHKFESLRCAALLRRFPWLGQRVMYELATPDLARWRDTRLKEVSSGTVLRELNLYRAIILKAKREWHWLGHNPFEGLRIPRDNPPRDRRIGAWEVRRICRWLGYRTNDVHSVQEQVALAFLIGLQTAMRSQEILGLQPGVNVDLVARVATVKHKTQYRTRRPREIPLTYAGVRLIRAIPPGGFTVSAASRDVNFRKAKRALMIEDMKFHDSRAEMLTRIAGKVDVLTLSRISGIKDLRLLAETYYRESSAAIAARLDPRRRI